MPKGICCVLALLAGSLLSLPLYSQIHESEQKLTDASIAASEEQTKRIQLELRHLKNHDWAGEYFFGDGLGVNVSLALAPDSGFVFSWRGCLGLYDLNYGEVEFSDGTIKLRFKYPNKRVGFEGIAPEFLPVRWGKRRYLVALDRMVDFTNAINAGTEPNTLFGGQSGRFLLRRGDEKGQVAGQPNIPAEYRSYLLASPIKAKISSVQQTNVKHSDRITTVTLDVGQADGLKQGMELFVHSPSSSFASAVVGIVNEHSAIAEIEQMEVTDADPVPAVDWKLSTKLSSAE